MKNTLCGIDIGSSLCHVIVAHALPDDGRLEILGTGSAPSRGVKTGSIVNIEAISHTISEAVREAELMSGIVIEEAMVNISGKHLESNNSRGVVAITNKDRVVDSEDVLRVIEGAQNIRLNAEQEIVHVLSREFSLDDERGIRDPIGMTGIRLEADVHIVTAGITALANLKKALAVSGIEFVNGVISSLASAEALLQLEEKEMGVAVADIGGGITDIILYTEGGVCVSSTIPIGGMHITQDLSIGLKIPLEAAEFVKKNYGSASVNMVDPTEKIELPRSSGRAPRHVFRQQIAEIISARMQEILELIDAQLMKSEKKSFLAGGVILCGGCALLEGCEELAEDVLDLSVSTRFPQSIDGFADRVNTPEFATGTGVLNYVHRMGLRPYGSDSFPVRGVLSRIKKWLVENV